MTKPFKKFVQTVEELDEKNWTDRVPGVISRILHSKDYQDAIEKLYVVIDRKKKENGGTLKKAIEYYASRIARSYRNVDGYELAQVYDYAMKYREEVFGVVESVDLNEESASASTSTAGVANPDAKPMFKKSKFMGHDMVDVDDETFHGFVRGKVPFKRWTNYVEDESLRKEMKDMYYKNKRMLVRNNRNGSMVFVK
jgi:hypothetical protein